MLSRAQKSAAVLDLVDWMEEHAYSSQEIIDVVSQIASPSPRRARLTTRAELPAALSDKVLSWPVDELIQPDSLIQKPKGERVFYVDQDFVRDVKELSVKDLDVAKLRRMLNGQVSGKFAPHHYGAVKGLQLLEWKGHTIFLEDSARETYHYILAGMSRQSDVAQKAKALPGDMYKNWTDRQLRFMTKLMPEKMNVWMRESRTVEVQAAVG